MDYNIIFKIAQINKWVDVPALLCVSWGLRRCFLSAPILTRVFVDVLSEMDMRRVPDSSYQSRNTLPLWMFQPITVSPQIVSAMPPCVRDLPRKMEETVLHLQNHGISSGSIAGGYVSRLVHEKDWDGGDIDIFHSCPSDDVFDRRVKETIPHFDESHDDTLEIDLVYKKIVDVISDFDLSCCQVAFNIETQQVTVTPALLYGIYSKTVICRVIPLKVVYPPRDGFTIGQVSEAIFRDAYIKKQHGIENLHFIYATVHCNYHHVTSIFHCFTCQMRAKRYEAQEMIDPKSQCISKWFARVLKYDARFGDYRFITVLSNEK